MAGARRSRSWRRWCERDGRVLLTQRHSRRPARRAVGVPGRQDRGRARDAGAGAGAGDRGGRSACAPRRSGSSRVIAIVTRTASTSGSCSCAASCPPPSSAPAPPFTLRGGRGRDVDLEELLEGDRPFLRSLVTRTKGLPIDAAGRTQVPEPRMVAAPRRHHLPHLLLGVPPRAERRAQGSGAPARARGRRRDTRSGR